MKNNTRGSLVLKLASLLAVAALTACGGGLGGGTSQGGGGGSGGGQETQIYGVLSAQEKELLGPDQDGNGVLDFLPALKGEDS